MESDAIVSRWKRTVLEAACAIGNVDIAKVVLESGVEISAANSVGRTPIYTAARNGHLEVLELLVQAGGDVTISDNDGRTPVYVTAFHGHVKEAQLLLSCGADLSVANKFGMTPLHLAAEQGHLELAKLFIEHGADTEEAEEGGWVPLITASSLGYVDMVELLIDRGAADVAASTNSGRTSLFSASAMGHVDVVQLLLSRGADVTIADNDGWTPLYSASAYGHHGAVRILLEHGASTATRTIDGQTPLYGASYHGHVEVAQLLLRQGADIAAANSSGCTALQAACRNGHIGVAKFLLQNGADINVADTARYTPLGSAANNGHAGVVRLLIDNGADCSGRTEHGWTALHSACSCGHLEVVETLLGKKAAAIDDTTNVELWTPLHLASCYGHIHVVKLLLDNGAKTTITNHQGASPLHSASARGHVDVVEALLAHRADASVSDNYGRVPLVLASGFGHIAATRALLKHGGANVSLADEDGTSPVIAASCSGHVELLRFLLAVGFSATEGDQNGGLTALNSAIANGDIEVTKVLLENGASMTPNKVGVTPLHIAVVHGKTEVARVLLENGADISATYNDGMTCLHAASQIGHSEVIKLLLRYGADPSPKDQHGTTPLHIAAGLGHMKAIGELLKGSADVAATDTHGRTPLLLASSSGRSEAAKELLAHGADVSTRDNHGLAPILVASERGHIEVVRVLLEHGSNLAVADPAVGMTPLTLAATGGHVELVKLLIKKQADPVIAQNDGRPPVDPVLFTAYVAIANQENSLAGLGSDEPESPLTEMDEGGFHALFKPIGQGGLAATKAKGRTNSNSEENELPPVEASSKDKNEPCPFVPKARTLCDTCRAILQNGIGRINFDIFSTAREILPVVMGGNTSGETGPLPHHQPHNQSNQFIHHLTVQSLISAALQGCYICNAVWNRVDPRMRQPLLDSDSTSPEPGNPPVPLTFCYLIDVEHLVRNHIKPGDLGPNGQLWAVTFRGEIMKVLNHGPDDMSFFTFIPSQEVEDLDLSDVLPSATSSAESLDFAASQLQNCLQNHEECKSSIDFDWLPSRLICLDGAEEEEEDQSVRLVSSRDISPGPYCTLSHCWGSAKFLKLTKDNLDSFSCNIPISDLPKTFRDSILVSRKLGAQYIWIDSLCIIQDDPDDWFNEAAQMYKVYSNSLFNICATGARNSSAGLFSSRNLALFQPCETNIPWFQDGGIFRILDLNVWNTQVLKSPLNMRAWVVQEYLLSPRQLHFSTTQIFWECLKTTAAEQFPRGLPEAIRCRGQSSRRQLQQSECDPQDEGQSKALYSGWTEIVKRYTRAKLSHLEDRNIALSGITRKFEVMLNDKCDAGIWRGNILRDILWHVEACRQGDGTPSENPKAYRAPSFSWMTIEGAINPASQTVIIDSPAQVLTMTIEEYKGSITGGSLRLQGLIKPLRVFRSKIAGRLLWLPKFRHGKHHLGWAISISSVVYMDVDRDYDDTYYCIILETTVAAGPVLGLVLRETGRVRGEFTRIGLLQCMGDDKELLTAHYYDEDCYPSESYDDVRKTHTISIV